MLNFGSDYANTSDLDGVKPGLVNVGYGFISTFGNIKSSMLVLFILTKLLMILSSVFLYFVKNRTRCGRLHLKKTHVHILEHLSTPCFFSFEMSSQIVLLVSAFTYLRFAKSYWSDEIILEGTQLLQFDFYLSITCILSTLYAFMSLFITASSKKWWGLDRQLKLQRTWYAKSHKEIMDKVGDVENKRKQLNGLERKFNRGEDRFDELKSFVG